MEQPATQLESVDILYLLKRLPHRYPFLMIDRIKSIRGDDFAIGVKNVTVNEPHFQGHFPGHPVMPGVLIIEGMAQTAGAIGLMARGSAAASLVYFTTIDEAKFRRPVMPGDTVEYHVTKIRRRQNISKYACEAFVDGQKVAEAIVGAVLVEEAAAE